mmetsp:Transcript_7515/g.13049  ORF Transcript_7515/g.13049 Transcript_7515/m.13049 type:complete len:111 (-) Transcript_7515:470-802(-)
MRPIVSKSSRRGGRGVCLAEDCIAGEGTEEKNGSANGARSQKALSSNCESPKAGGQKSLSLMISISGIAMPRRMEAAPEEGSSTGRCGKSGTTRVLEGVVQLHHLMTMQM